MHELDDPRQLAGVEERAVGPAHVDDRARAEGELLAVHHALQVGHFTYMRLGIAAAGASGRVRAPDQRLGAGLAAIGDHALDRGAIEEHAGAAAALVDETSPTSRPCSG
jgi:hypothetical protein